VLATFVLRLVQRSLDDGDVVGVAEHVDCGDSWVIRSGDDLLAYLRTHDRAHDHEREQPRVIELRRLET